MNNHVIPEDAVEAAKVEAALRAFIASIDYDLHKQLECDEEDGTDRYPALAANFIVTMKTHES